MGWSDTTRDPEDTGAGLPRKTSEQLVAHYRSTMHLYGLSISKCKPSPGTDLFISLLSLCCRKLWKAPVQPPTQNTQG